MLSQNGPYLARCGVLCGTTTPASNFRLGLSLNLSIWTKPSRVTSFFKRACAHIVHYSRINPGDPSTVMIIHWGSWIPAGLTSINEWCWTHHFMVTFRGRLFCLRIPWVCASAQHRLLSKIYGRTARMIISWHFSCQKNHVFSSFTPLNRFKM